VRNPSSTILAITAAAAAVLGVWSGGCADDPQTLNTSSSTGAAGVGPSGTGAGQGGNGDGGNGNGSGAGNGNGGNAAQDNQGEELFLALEEDLLGACGVCHDAGGPSNTPFLAGPDRYATISSWPDMVKEDWESSVLMTYPVSGGGHTGINLDSSAYVDTLFPQVQEWLEEEARGFVQGGGEGGGSGEGGAGNGPEPTVDPFKPILGFNAIYLTPLDDDFTGMALTFNAEELTEDTLQLTNLEVHTTADLGLHIVHPVFVVWPVGAEAEPDPVDSFSGLDAYFPEGSGDPVGPGILVLANWSANAKLSIAFESIDTWTESGGEGGGGGGGAGGVSCDAQGDFDDVAAAFSPCAGQCHNGQNPGATGAVDMRDLDNDPGAACVQIRNRVDLDNPDDSQIFVATDPNGGAGHPFKFGNNVGDWNAFKDQVTGWVQAEAAAQ